MAKKQEIDIRKFVDSVQKLIDNSLRNSVVDGIISSDTDMSKFTCNVKVNNIEFFDVPVRVLISKQASFLEIPKKDSHCLLTFRDSNQNRPQIMEVDECEKILVKIGDQSLEISENGFIFNEGKNDGLIKINQLITKLNTIENDLNLVKNIFTSWAPVPNDGGAALKAAISTWSGQLLQLSQKTDIENDKIKQ